MREVILGGNSYWFAEDFGEHMAADVYWLPDPEYDAAFDTILEEQKMAAFTKVDPAQPTYPGYINISFEGRKAILTVRGDPETIHGNPGTVDATESDPLGQGPDQIVENATIQLILDQGDWDQFVAQATRERGLVQLG